MLHPYTVKVLLAKFIARFIRCVNDCSLTSAFVAMSLVRVAKIKIMAINPTAERVADEKLIINELGPKHQPLSVNHHS